MDFNLSREHQLIRKMMADFTENEVKPIAAETDRTCEYPRENIEKLFDLGVMGICVPQEYGGAGSDALASAICIEELSKQCASTGDIVATHNGLCCDPIMAYGTEEQKAKISQTAQAILDARALYPDASLAALYDELTMPSELRKAHQQNDIAVMQAYGMPIKETTESSCVAELMRRYQAMTKAESSKK